MGEYCLDCLNKLENTHCTERDYILSDEDDLDLCEGCGQWKRVVIVKRDGKIFYDLAFPIRLIRRALKKKQRS